LTPCFEAAFTLERLQNPTAGAAKVVVAQRHRPARIWVTISNVALQRGPKAGEELEAWFFRHARPLPWRRNGIRSDAIEKALADDRNYLLLLVEVMAQQTRIETVVARLEPFLERFPSLTALADAATAEVLDAWAGLGYYRRAHALHQAAQQVSARSSEWPSDERGWQQLPGIGPYAAAALAAQSNGFATPAIDGNVRRVAARLLHHPAPRDPDIRTLLATLLDLDGSYAPERASRVEALIELGATLCTPRAPNCGSCPLADHCRAHRAGASESVPQPRQRAGARELHLHALLLQRDDGQIAFERRSARALWGGTLGLPWRPSKPTQGEPIGSFSHRLTHRLIHAHLYHPMPSTCSSSPLDPPLEPEWHHPSRVELPEIDRRALQLLADAGSIPPLSAIP
jgi:A/G-specific adenine glycosylase